jgi:hypothetical protein
MKRTIVFAALLIAAAAHAEIRGTWAVDHSWSTDPGKIQLNLMRQNNHFGSTFSIDAFTGLTAADVSHQGDVKFELRREAGVIAFDGSFRDGEGVGHFVFTPDASYASKLRSMGVRSDDDVDDEKLLSLALHDVSTDFIRAMRREGYDEPLDHYVSMRIFRVTPELVSELRSLGYDHLGYDDLIASRIHKATPEYIRAMKAAGCDRLSMEQLVATRIHKATPEFLQQMAQLGYTHLDYDDLIAFRIHGVSPEFVGALRDLGYTGIRAEDLVAMRIHRVTPEYIREVESAGYHHVPVEKLIEMRIHGIDSSYLSKMK